MGKTELKIEIDADLVDRASAAGVDVGAVVEAALREALPVSAGEPAAERWARENAHAIAAHQDRIDRHGVFGEDLRTW